MLVQSPEEGDSKGEEAGPVRSFDLDSGDYKGDFSDEEGIPLMAREIFPLPGGNWAALSGDLNPLESHVEFTRYTPEGKVISKEQFSFPPLPEGDPEEWIHSFALNDRGDLTALYGWTRGRPGGILRIRNFTEGNRQAEIIPKEDFAHALPLSPDGPFRFWNLRYRNGRYYMTVDMKPDPYDGILILDEELNPLDYNTGYWLYNCPWDVAVDAEGRLYASNFYHDTVKVYNRDGILARTAENDKNGYREGFMNNPADLVLSCGTIYVFDSGNGRIVRFSSMIKEPLGQSNPSQRIVPYRMGQNSLLLYFYFFSAGMLLFISLNSFIFAMVFKDKSLLLLGFFFLSFLFFSIDNTFSVRGNINSPLVTPLG